MAKNKSKLSIIIPVLNEGENLKVLLRILEAVVYSSHEILVVHDIPNDNSIPVVKDLQKNYRNIRLVHNTLGRGVVYAIKAGVNSANGKYMLIIAADDMGSILSINDMIDLMDRGCDMVNATRYAHGGKHIGGIFISSFISKLANKLFHLIGGVLTDPTLGVKMFRKDLFENLKLESKPIGWAVSFELAIKAQLAGWKLGEVPVISLNRLYGKNKSTFRLKWLSEYSKWFLYGMKNLPFFKNKSNVMVKIPQNMKI